MSLLSRLDLSPRYPMAPTIRGKVFGIHFMTGNEVIAQHFQKHAWYVGGAPSLTLTRVRHGIMKGMYRDECHFTVSASELKHAMQIPMLRSSQLLRWETLEKSKITLCNHCNREGHISKACPDADKTNAQNGIRGACIMCSSFDHVVASCPMMSMPDAVCSICRAGKHTVRACPLARGSYAKAVVGSFRKQPSGATNVYSNNCAQVVPKNVSGESGNATSQAEKQLQAEISRMKRDITQLTQSITSLTQKYDGVLSMVTELTQANKALTAQIAQLVNHVANNKASGGVQCYDDHDNSQTATATPVHAPKKGHSRSSSKNQVPSNQGRLNDFLAPKVPTATILSSPATTAQIANVFAILNQGDDEDIALSDDEKQVTQIQQQQQSPAARHQIVTSDPHNNHQQHQQHAHQHVHTTHPSLQPRLRNVWQQLASKHLPQNGQEQVNNND